MSEHATAIKPADDPAFKLPASMSALSQPLCIGGVAALVVGWAIGSFAVSARFGLSAYLNAFIYCLTIALGCLFFVLIQHLCRAGWSVVVRRVAELMMVMVVPLGVLFLPVLFSLWFSDGTLYQWDNPAYAAEHGAPPAAWEEKSRFLNTGWFTIRTAVYFAIWAGLAYYYYKNSRLQDETGEKALTDKMQWWSGPAVMLFSGSLSLAAFDWVMSLSPMWFSTMFGVYMFSGGVLAAHCAIAALTYVLQKNGAMRDEVTVEHYHDLGKLIFGFIFFWTYIAFSQYMLIWYGNIPEEQTWFFARQTVSFASIGVVLIFFHWLLPFLGTMSRHVRRRPNLVFFWAVYVLVMHYIDLYYCIMPEAGVGFGGIAGILGSLLCVLGMVGLMIGLVFRVAEQTTLVPVRDPRLAESIAFENI